MKITRPLLTIFEVRNVFRVTAAEEKIRSSLKLIHQANFTLACQNN